MKPQIKLNKDAYLSRSLISNPQQGKESKLADSTDTSEKRRWVKAKSGYLIPEKKPED